MDGSKVGTNDRAHSPKRPSEKMFVSIAWLICTF